MDWYSNNSYNKRINTNGFNTGVNTNGFGNGFTNNQNTSNQNIKNIENRLSIVEKKLNEITIDNKNSKVNKIVHFVTCSNCKKNNIVGNRFLCGNCNQTNVQYNLCEECIKNRSNLHPNNHFFIMIHDSSLWH